MNLLEAFRHLTPGFYLMLTTFAAVAIGEGMQPTLSPRISVSLRWLNNFLWLAINSFFLRAAFPLLGVAWAEQVTEKGWGILSWLDSPIWLNFIVGLVAMDVAAYGTHILMHKLPWLWRLHAVHHSDIDFDCTTGFRFHPLEALLTTAVRLAAIATLGLDPIMVLIYESWVGLQNLYGHANARLPAVLERLLRWVVVTPDMHRVHHSVRLEEGLSNYGIVFPWWDHLFGTYREQPAGGHENMKIGLSWIRTESAWTVPKLLVAPFTPLFIPASSNTPSETQQRNA
jgi:sterol desaturase/sphingolipid hydroxylase (fatty acid hydroxylase superfamily)